MSFFGLLQILFYIRIASSATITFTGNSGSWSTANLWDTGTIPTALDDVIIPALSQVAVSTTISFQTLAILGTATISGTQTSLSGTIYVTGTLNVKSTVSLSGTGCIDITSGSVNIKDRSSANIQIIGRGGSILLDSGSTAQNVQLVEGETIIYGTSSVAVDLLNISTTATLGSRSQTNNATVTVKNLYWYFGAISQAVFVQGTAVLDEDTHVLDRGQITFTSTSIVAWNGGSIEATYGSFITVDGLMTCSSSSDTCYFYGDPTPPTPKFYLHGTFDATRSTYVEQTGSVYFYGFEIFSYGTWKGGILSSKRTNFFVYVGSNFDKKYPLSLRGLDSDQFVINSESSYGNLFVQGHTVTTYGTTEFDNLWVDSTFVTDGADLIVNNLTIYGTIKANNNGRLSVTKQYYVSGTFSTIEVTFGKAAAGILEGTSRWIGVNATHEGKWVWNEGIVLIGNYSRILNFGTITLGSSISLHPDIDNNGGVLLNLATLVLFSNGTTINITDPISLLQCTGTIQFKLSQSSIPPNITLSSTSAIGGGTIQILFDSPTTYNTIPSTGYALLKSDGWNSSLYVEDSNSSPLKLLCETGSPKLCLNDLGVVTLFKSANAPSTQKCNFKTLDARTYCPLKSSANKSYSQLHILISMLLMIILFITN